MRRYFIVAGLAVLVSVTGVATAQVNHRTQRDSEAQKHMRQPSPAEWARIKEAQRLGEAAYEALNAGDFPVAEADARQAVAEGELSGYSDETLASALYSQGKYQEALQAYKKMADQGDSFPRNLLPYALLSLRVGHWAQAAAAYDKALPQLGGGDLMHQKGSFSPSIPQPVALETAIHIGMGLTMDGGDFHGPYLERYQSALSHFQKAKALAPDSALAYYYYGYGLNRLNRHAQAQAAFQKAAALDHDGPVKAAAETALRMRH